MLPIRVIESFRVGRVLNPFVRGAGVPGVKGLDMTCSKDTLCHLVCPNLGQKSSEGKLYGVVLPECVSFPKTRTLHLSDFTTATAD